MTRSDVLCHVLLQSIVGESISSADHKAFRVAAPCMHGGGGGGRVCALANKITQLYNNYIPSIHSN